MKIGKLISDIHFYSGQEMNQGTSSKYLFLKEQKKSTSDRVLFILNTVESAEDLALTIHILCGSDIGFKAARNILIERNKLNGFRNLSQVAAVPGIGNKKFAEIVNALSTNRDSLAGYILDGRKKGTVIMNPSRINP